MIKVGNGMFMRIADLRLACNQFEDTVKEMLWNNPIDKCSDDEFISCLSRLSEFKLIKGEDE